MAREKSYRGIYAREASILIDFQWNGRRRETLSVRPTDANLQRAARIKLEVETRISLGRFNLDAYAEYFPDSPFLKARGYNRTRDGATFRAVSDQWLKIAGPELSPTTVIEYRNILNCHFLPTFGDHIMSEITYEELALHIAAIHFESGKTFNNCMIPLRQMYRYALATKKITEDVTVEIKSRKRQRPLPDPLELEEVELLLAHVLKSHGEQWHNYFEFALFSGLRPSEQIMLKWPKVDSRRGLVRVEAARVRTIEKGTKTHAARDVELVDRAMRSLQRQREHTQMKSEYVFLNPYTAEPFADTSMAVQRVWRPSLRILGIRDRDARETRHTYATMALMAGVNPAYIARQLGHANAKMVYEVYAKWIDGADKSMEKNRMNAWLNVTPASQETLKRA